MLMQRLAVLAGQVRMRVNNRIGREMMDVSEGNTSCVVTDKEHYQQVLQYRIAKQLHLPGILFTKILIYFCYFYMNLLRLYDISLKSIWNTCFLSLNLHHYKNTQR